MREVYWKSIIVPFGRRRHMRFHYKCPREYFHFRNHYKVKERKIVFVTSVCMHVHAILLSTRHMLKDVPYWYLLNKCMHLVTQRHPPHHFFRRFPPPRRRGLGNAKWWPSLRGPGTPHFSWTGLNLHNEEDVTSHGVRWWLSFPPVCKGI